MFNFQRKIVDIGHSGGYILIVILLFTSVQLTAYIYICRTFYTFVLKIVLFRHRSQGEFVIELGYI